MNDLGHYIVIAAMAVACGFASGMIAAQRQGNAIEIAYQRCDAQRGQVEAWLTAARQLGQGPTVGRK